MCYFHPYLGKWSNLTNILQMGCNHQPVLLAYLWIDDDDDHHHHLLLHHYHHHFHHLHSLFSALNWWTFKQVSCKAIPLRIKCKDLTNHELCGVPSMYQEVERKQTQHLSRLQNRAESATCTSWNMFITAKSQAISGPAQAQASLIHWLMEPWNHKVSRTSCSWALARWRVEFPVITGSTRPLNQLQDQKEDGGQVQCQSLTAVKRADDLRGGWHLPLCCAGSRRVAINSLPLSLSAMALSVVSHYVIIESVFNSKSNVNIERRSTDECHPRVWLTT